MKFQYIISLDHRRFIFRFVGLCSLILINLTDLWAQMQQVKAPVVPAQPEEDYTWWYISLFILSVALAGAVMWKLKIAKAEKEAAGAIGKKEKAMSEDNSWDVNAVDADKEMEWYRRHKKSVETKPKKKKLSAENLPQTKNILNRNPPEKYELLFSEEEFKEKLQTLQYNQLPIFKFQKLELARPFAPLSISSDDALMSAIEQTQDEYEEDEQIRDLAVRILTRFRTRNSVEALSQVALYDISSNVRSKAVSVLADFDHESVFETILMCCADPTREVRAAAARGLFRLSFDRSDAWTRIAETNDEFKMRQAALAAKEADLLKRSFDRLVHHDQKIAYEAVALLSLMIKAGETEEIYAAIEKHKENNVRLALLHVIGLTKEEKTLAHLSRMLKKHTLPVEVKNKIDEVILSFQMIPA